MTNIYVFFRPMHLVIYDFWLNTKWFGQEPSNDYMLETATVSFILIHIDDIETIEIGSLLYFTWSSTFIRDYHIGLSYHVLSTHLIIHWSTKSNICIEQIDRL